MARISASNLNLTQKGVTLIDNACFEFEPGIIFLLGSNGSGKSTLMLTISGTLEPTSGEITIDGDGSSLLRRKKVSFISDIGILGANLRLEQVIKQYANLFKVDQERVIDCIALFPEMNSHLKKFIYQLSTGWQKKVTIICTLMRPAQIFIFDEPTNGLDTVSSEIVDKILRKIRNDGKTAIVVTHDDNLVNRMTGNVWEIADGNLKTSERITKEMKVAMNQVKIDVGGFSNTMLSEIKSIEGIIDAKYTPTGGLDEAIIKRELEKSGFAVGNAPINVIQLPEEEAKALLEKLGGIPMEAPAALRRGILIVESQSDVTQAVMEKLKKLECSIKKIEMDGGNGI